MSVPSVEGPALSDVEGPDVERWGVDTAPALATTEAAEVPFLPGSRSRRSYLP